jgi:hypothetical protein
LNLALLNYNFTDTSIKEFQIFFICFFFSFYLVFTSLIFSF